MIPLAARLIFVAEDNVGTPVPVLINEFAVTVFAVKPPVKVKLPWTVELVNAVKTLAFVK